MLAFLRSRTRKRTTLAALVAITTAAGVGTMLSFAPTASADELLTNGGFESGSLSGWTCSGDAEVITGGIRSGSHALSATPSNSDYAKCSQTVSVAPNTTYSLSAYVKGAYVYLGVENGSSTWTPGTGPDYSRLNVSFTTSANQTKATVYLHGWYAQPGYFADDVSLTGPGSPAPDPTPPSSPSPSSPPPSEEPAPPEKEPPSSPPPSEEPAPPEEEPSSPPPSEEPSAGTPVAANGQLKVCGNKLCNKNGKAIQLRGMSTHGTQWYSQCITDKSLDALATDWRADVLRVSTYVQEGGYETDPQKFTDLANRIIDQASARGMYVIVDWHMLNPGDPNHNLERAKKFFTDIAGRHKDKPNVLYEIANEPSEVSWSTIKSYAEKIIPVIRTQDSDGIVLVGTRAWSSLGVSEGSNESEVVNNKVNASNIMYTFHFYAASHGDEYLGALSRAADKIPMFVTEFGTQNYAGEEANDFTMSQKYLDLMAQKKISWVNWNFSDDHRSGAVFKTGTCSGGTFTGTSVLKEAGVWIRERIRSADAF